MVKLKEMTKQEFEAYMEEMTPDYARDLAGNLNITYEKARKNADEQMERLFPEGFGTKDQYLFNVEDEETGNVVGVLWFHLKEGDDRAFIYHILVHEGFRRQGYGKQMLKKLEEVVREMGGHHIGLSVFGDNPDARKLYEKVGYRPAAISMTKEV